MDHNKRFRKVYIYFFIGLMTRRVKIGIADCPCARLRQCQAGSPDALVLLGMIEYVNRIIAKREEDHLHYHFRKSVSHGEWFKLSEELEEFTNKLSPVSHSCLKCAAKNKVTRTINCSK